MGSEDISTRAETTTSESSKIEKDMDRELIHLQTGQSMLENMKMTRETAKGLNTLLTDRYLKKEYGQTVNMFEKDN